MTLRCETDTPEMGDAVERAFREHDQGVHPAPRADFEHGQWFVTCPQCGACWSAGDMDPDGWDFEQLAQGDGYCGDAALDALRKLRRKKR
jgi:hypothetical protein